MTKKKDQTKETKKTFQFEELNWKQIDSLNRDTTIIYIPISPLEEHGPHLPIGTDFLTSRDAAKSAIEILQNDGVKKINADIDSSPNVFEMFKKNGFRKTTTFIELSFNIEH